MTRSLPAPLHIPAEPIALASARRVRPARVIRTALVDPSRATTTPLPFFDRDEAATAWIAELRGGQAGR